MLQQLEVPSRISIQADAQSQLLILSIIDLKLVRALDSIIL